ncbi:hypothetical protein FSARC_7760 [Fusarium sarcochroum]|uniref:Uncharacterized protein n=1 Tax=Fusarium sarcochroum TaxID=1208366 RepID=A0A8H4TUM0_9HYPO|nr:hypothetical protein FSARC_7760 [Fusarium sarcochroum]
MVFRTAIISLALVCAIHTDGSKIDALDEDKCPDNWTGVGIDGEMICCFGRPETVGTDDGVSGYCCVYDNSPGSRNINETGCSTRIDVTETGYMSLVSAASKSIMATASASHDEKTSLSITQTAEPTAPDSTEGTNTENAGSIVTKNLIAKFSGVTIVAMLFIY